MASAQIESLDTAETIKRALYNGLIDVNWLLLDRVAMSVPKTYKAVRLHPEDHTIHVETLPCPQIEEPDDAIVKVTLAGLCGSDLHGYRGHEHIPSKIVTGHEFIGEVVALGKSYSKDTQGRPALYATLKVGDKVVAPFTTSCGECHFCRIGFSSRCVHDILFGCTALNGGQAQYVRVPKAGGTLFVVSSIVTPSPDPPSQASIVSFADSSLLLLADILPTGYFTALQALQHPNVLPLLSGCPYPLSALACIPNAGRLVTVLEQAYQLAPAKEDRVLTLAVIGLGPVGICGVVSLLDLLAVLEVDYRVVAIDLNKGRRQKIEAIYAAIPTTARGVGEFVAAAPDKAKDIVKEWTNGVGCNAVLEIVGNSPALVLAYSLVRPFGVISSTGVHQAVPFPLTGWDCFDKNVSLAFGRCPVRSIFPLAVDLLQRRQEVFGSVGSPISLVDKVVGIDEAPEAYRAFDKGECGKVLFDPWK